MTRNSSLPLPPALGNAQFETGPCGAPRSRLFNDTYFDNEDGWAESRHAFLRGCDVENLWRGRDRFSIGETGFGTGLNFLAAWHAWKADAHRPQRLNYISVEGFPLTSQELTGCFSAWPELAPLAAELIRHYPIPQSGYHRLFLAEGQVALTLLMGPVLGMLESFEAEIDAWFLDGFAPDRNPDMWQPNVLKELARLSHDKTRLATFTVASQVRRDLQAAGFRVEKRAGHGKKLEVLAGHFSGPKHKSRVEPWFTPPATVTRGGGHVAVIGSGLAGAATAYAFRRRGWAITVIERHHEIAAEASATPAAILAPRLTAGASLDGAFYSAAWPALLTLLNDLEENGFDVGRQRCGVLRLATTKEEEVRHLAIMTEAALPDPILKWVTAAEASDLAGIQLSSSGLYFPDGGYLSPPLLCAALLQGARILMNRTAAQLIRNKDNWQIKDKNGTTLVTAQCVVLAGGLDCASFQLSRWLPLSARRGQLTQVSATPQSRHLRCVLTGDGHVIPMVDEHHVIGATFDHVHQDERDETQPTPDAEADAHNRALAETLVPGLLSGGKTATKKSWAGLRCTTLDHLPLAGPLPDHAAYLSDFADLRHGHRWSTYPNARYHEGVFVLTGLGAHGVVAAPLAAELLASHVCGDPHPVAQSIVSALHPGRFIVRDLKRQKA